MEAFNILELPAKATFEECRKKFHEIARSCHPDKGQTEDQEVVSIIILIFVIVYILTLYHTQHYHNADMAFQYLKKLASSEQFRPMYSCARCNESFQSREGARRHERYNCSLRSTVPVYSCQHCQKGRPTCVRSVFELFAATCPKGGRIFKS